MTSGGKTSCRRKSRHRAAKVYRFGANPGAGKGAGPGIARPRLRSWPLGRRSGRTSALPYPPPRPSGIVARRASSGNRLCGTMGLPSQACLRSRPVNGESNQRTCE